MIRVLLILPFAALLAFYGGTTRSFSRNPDVPSACSAPLLTAEEGAIVVEVRGIATENLITYFVGDSLLLPFTTFCKFLRISSGVSPDHDTLFGEFPVGQSFQIIRSARIARFRSKQLPVGDSVLYENNGELFVGRGLLEACLGIQLRFSLVNLELHVDPDRFIPLVDQTRREQKYASLAFYDAEQGNEGPTAPVTRLLGGSVNMDWQLLGRMQKQQQSALGVARLGAPFLFGTLELYGSAAYQSSGYWTSSLDRWNWSYTLPNSPLLRRITVGGVQYLDSYQYLLEISNAPLFQSNLFDFSTLDGHTQPGWTVELYDGAELSQVARADSLGYYQFEVPLRYGFNNLSIRTIGQHGEEFVEDRSATLAIQMLPPGRFDYTARLLTERFHIESPVSGSGRVALGMFDWLTLEGGATFQSSAARLLKLDSLSPIASLQARPWGSTLLNLAYDFNYRIASGRVEAPIAGIGRYRVGIDKYSLDSTMIQATGTAYLSLGAIQTGINAFYYAEPSLRRAEVTPQIFGSFGNFSTIASATYGWEKRSGSGGEFVQAPPRNGLLTSSLQFMTSTIRGLFLTVRATIDHSNWLSDRLEFMASSTLLWPLQVGLKCSVNDYQWKRPGIDLTLSLDLDQARMNVVSSYYDNQTISNATVEGSVVASSAGVRAARTSSLGQSAVIVMAFHDVNRNGRRDVGDTTLGVTSAVLHSGATQISRNDGAFYNLIADMPYLVEIDRWGHADLGLFPRRRELPIYALPSTVHVIQVAFTDGFDVSGTCRIASSPEGEAGGAGSVFNGLRIMLVSETADALYTGEVFTDGTIVISGVAPGEYRIEFDERQLETRGLEPVRVPANVKVDYGNEQLPDIHFHIIGQSR